MLQVSLRLLCTKTPGTLSYVFRHMHFIGLKNQNHKIETTGPYSCISITATGELNCTPESFRSLLRSAPGVLQIQKLQMRGGRNVDMTEVKTHTSEIRLPPKGPLTPAIILSAEKRLADILGPVASMIIESVVQDCTDTGELYARLANELNDPEERDHFLSALENN